MSLLMAYFLSNGRKVFSKIAHNSKICESSETKKTCAIWYKPKKIKAL